MIKEDEHSKMQQNGKVKEENKIRDIDMKALFAT